MSRRRVAPDQLFAALDGRRLRVKGHSWLVEVYGVFDEAERRWVQLALAGDQHQVLTLQLASGQGPSHAVRSLSLWLTDPATTTEVIDHTA